MAYNNIGVLLSQLNKHEEAVQNYDKAIEFNPNAILQCYYNAIIKLLRSCQIIQAHTWVSNLELIFVETIKNIFWE